MNSSFNPRSRTGNDRRFALYSIHKNSFNPRSRTGNDAGWLLHKGRYRVCFNPRSRTGNDDFNANQCNSWIKVSIHVPARGTTATLFINFVVSMFQSTFPHGERRRGRGSISMSSMTSFNPRSRTGNDSRFLSATEATYMFQSTFPHGERHHPDQLRLSEAVVSIHVPARGTTDVYYTYDKFGVFQSTFPHGERHLLDDTYGPLMWFQSTFPHGERPPHPVLAGHCLPVSIHVPARGTTVI